MPTSTALIISNAGTGNIGDDLLLVNGLSVLSEVVREMSIEVAIFGVDVPADSLKRLMAAADARVRLVHPIRCYRARVNHLFRLLARVSHSQFVFVPGGGLLGNHYGWFRVALVVLGVFCRLSGKGLYGLGLGADRSTRVTAKMLNAAVYRLFTAATFRDVSSARACAAPEGRAFADPVFALLSDVSNRWSQQRDSAVAVRPPSELSVAIREVPWNPMPLRELATFIDSVAAEHSLKRIRFLAFDDKDYSFSLRVSEFLADSTLVVEVEQDPLRVIEALSRSAAAITIRYHSMVLAATCGVVFYPISYDQKTDSLLDHLRALAPPVHVNHISIEGKSAERFLLDESAVSTMTAAARRACRYIASRLMRDVQDSRGTRGL